MLSKSMMKRWGSAEPRSIAGDWVLTDVPPSPLKGLLTHFDYSGPVVTENITSIRIGDRAALFFSLVLVSLPLPSHSSHCPGMARLKAIH